MKTMFITFALVVPLLLLRLANGHEDLNEGALLPGEIFLPRRSRPRHFGEGPRFFRHHRKAVAGKHLVTFYIYALFCKTSDFSFLGIYSETIHKFYKLWMVSLVSFKGKICGWSI